VTPGQDYVWVVGVPGSAGSANSDTNVSATAGGTGGNTVFDIAGTGVAGGVVAHGGQGGDTGNTGIGGAGGYGSANTAEFGGGTGGTNLPSSSGSGSGTGGQGGTDNPLTLYSSGLLSSPPQAWYILDDTSSGGKVNDSSGNNNPAAPGSYGGGGLAYAQLGAPAQVPAYTGTASPPASPNPTTAGSMLRFVLAQLNQQSGYILCPGFSTSGTELTVSCWVTPDPSGTWGNTATGSFAIIGGNCEISYGNPGVSLFLENLGTPAHPNWQLSWYCSNGTNSGIVNYLLPPVADTSVYIAATFSSGAMTLYVNGSSAGTASAGFTSLPGWPAVRYGLTFGSDPQIYTDWFFGYMSNIWVADGVLSSAGVTQAYKGNNTGSSTAGGAGGGASGGPAADGGNGAAGSGSAGGAGGTAPSVPATEIGLVTPASAGIAGAAGSATNTGITGGAGAGGGGAGSSTSPPNILTVNIPFTTAAAYCGTDAVGGFAGNVYNPVIQGTNGRLFTGGLAADTASGSKNSLLIVQPGLAALLAGNTVLRVTLTVTNSYAQASQDALMQVGWSSDTFLPGTYTAADISGSAGVVEIPVGAYTVTADLTESQLGTYLANGTATALVLGPGPSPTFAAFNASTAPDFYTAVYGPGAVDSAGNPLQPYLTVTYAVGTANIQQGSPGGAGGILVTYVNQAQTLVGNFAAQAGTAVNGQVYSAGINASGGQLTATTVVIGTTSTTAGGRLGSRAGRRLGSGAAATNGAVLGYSTSTSTVTESTPGTYYFTVPAGVYYLNVQCWGGGAGATGGYNGQGQGGGGGGAYAAEPAYGVEPGDVIEYSVGAGGAGLTVGNNSASNGNASGFDVTGVAGGGVLAQGGQSYNGNYNYGPGGGTNGNTVCFSGGNGGPLNGGQSNGSGGGGSAGSTSRGFGGSTGGAAGGAGSGGGAAGGAGTAAGHNGSNGSAPGGGGGGAGSGTSGFTGGSGAAGKVVISYVATSTLATSVATESGTDEAGNPYPAGTMTPAVTQPGQAAAPSSTANAAIGYADTIGTQRVVDGTDGQVYATQRLSLVLASSVAITSTSWTTILSSTVGARSYRVHGQILLECNASAGSQALRWTGPGSPGGTLSVVWVEGTTSASVGANPASASMNPSITMSNTTVWTVNIDGVVNFTSTGTFAVQGAQPNNGDEFTAVTPSFLDIMPV
jgi:hypothetical protein